MASLRPDLPRRASLAKIWHDDHGSNRYRPHDGGFNFGIGITPIIGDGTFLPFGGMSFGAGLCRDLGAAGAKPVPCRCGGMLPAGPRLAASC
ncbi:MAG: hypothetical protein EXR75_04625 [Myxococcales bacterium]|nr:hypothetical protein [Myxococcales bacterium]